MKKWVLFFVLLYLDYCFAAESSDSFLLQEITTIDNPKDNAQKERIGRVSGAAWSPNNECYAVASRSLGAILLFDSKTNQCVKKIKYNGNYLSPLVFSQDSKLLLGGGVLQDTCIWDIEKNEKINEIPIQKTRAAAFNSDGLIALVKQSNILVCAIKENNTWETVHTITPEYDDQDVQFHRDSIDSVIAWKKTDNNVLVYVTTNPFVSRKTVIHFLDIKNKSELQKVSIDVCKPISLDNNGTSLACIVKDNEIQIVNCETGSNQIKLEGDNNNIELATFSNCGNYLFLALENKTIKIWDLKSGNCLGVFKGHTKPISSLIVSPHGNRLISLSNDGRIKIWDIYRLLYYSKRLVPSNRMIPGFSRII